MGFVRPLLRAFLAVCLIAVTAGIGVQAAERNLAVTPAQPQPATEPRIALVIGNADYANAPLANPVNDARAIAARLTELRFRVTRLENASQAEMYDAIRAFGDQLHGGGVGLFYYAGHALQVRGRNYLLPARAAIEREDELVYRTVDTGQILDKMENARNRVNVVILDACRSSPFGREFRNITPGLAVVDAPHNTLIAFATAPGAVASDGSGRNGLYTQHLLQALASPGLGLEDVFKRVRAGVRQDSAGRQVPWENTSLEVDFYFDPLPNQTVAAAPAAPAAAAAPDPLTLELVFWESVKGSPDPEDYRAYLKRYPEGQFAVLARNRLRALTAPAAPPVVAPAPPVASPATTTQPQPQPPAAAATPPPSPSPPTAQAVSPPPPAPVKPLPAPPATTAPATVAVVPPQPLPAPSPAPVAAPAPPTTPPAATIVAAPGTAPALAPLRVLSGPTGEVLAIALSRSGAQALTGSADRSLRQWDLATGRELRRYNGHAAAVTATAFGPDQRFVLSGSADRSVRLWDAASGSELARLDGHRAAVSAVAFGPTARYAASAADDGELLLWELPGGALIRRASSDGRRVRSAAFSPEGRYLLTASDDGGVRLWDVGSLRLLRSFGPLSSAALSAAFSEDGRRVGAVDGRGEVWSWDARSGALLQRFASGNPGAGIATIASDGATALTAGADGALALWEIASARPLWRASAAAPFTAVALGPRGAMALAAGNDLRLLLWSTAR